MIIRLLLCLFIVISSGTCSILLGQDENYQPVQIQEPLNNEDNTTPKTNNRSDKKRDQVPVKEDALTQEEIRKERLNRIRLGLSNFGLQFGTYTYISATPTIGYMVVKNRLEIGGGPVLMYQRIRYTSFDALSFFVYGGDIYARGFVWKGLNLEARYELVNKPSYYDLNRRLNVHHLLIGAGYAAPIGQIGAFNISALFNVLNNEESIYRGTFGNFPLILNMGFGFGLGGK